MFRIQGALTGLLLALVAGPALAQPYRVIDLGVLPGQTTSIPTDINNQLQVVGVSGDQAFIWDPINGMRPLGLATSRVQINNGGIIVAVNNLGDHQDVVAVWNGAQYMLPQPPDAVPGEAIELTDSNLLLLRGYRSWLLINGGYVDLTAAFGGAMISGISDAGVVGANAETGSFVRLADGGVVPTPYPVSRVGPAGHFTGADFYGFPDGTMIKTGIVGQPALFTPAFHGMNRRGDVVGNLFRFWEFGPFLYRPNQSVAIEGTGCECSLVSARAINDDGDIAGIAQFFNSGAKRAVLLVPIPPLPPQNVAYTVSGRTVTLSWSPSAGALESIVEAGSSSGASDLFVGSVGATTQVVVTVPAARYYVRVRARNAIGLSDPSREVIIDVP